MKRIAAAMALMAAMLQAVPAVANAPYASARPIPRPGAVQSTRPEYAVVVRDAPGVQVSLRPVPRPAHSVAPAARPSQQTVAVRNVPRPEPVIPPNAPVGKICGNRQIQGQVLPAISGQGGCGIAKPVRVVSVSGVRLQNPAVMNCDAAEALNKWVRSGAKKAIGSRGGGLEVLRVADDYSCRPRNNRDGARMSEHGLGNAIDISGFELKNGDRISVLENWGRGREGRILRQMHRSACGPFGTVLGPEADQYHLDHLHFDIARYNNGSYCR